VPGQKEANEKASCFQCHLIGYMMIYPTPMMASLELFVFSLVHVLVQQKSVTVDGNLGKR